MNCTKMHLAAGLCPDPLGELQRSPSPLAVVWGGAGGEGKGIGREGRGLRKGVWRDGEGRTYGASTLTPSIENFWLRHCLRELPNQHYRAFLVMQSQRQIHVVPLLCCVE